MKTNPRLKFGAKGKGGLLLIFGIMVFILVSIGFAVIGFILPLQVHSSMEHEITGSMLPEIRVAFEQSNKTIKEELDAKRDATLARAKTAFSAQKAATGTALIKTILPLMEEYDVDGAAQVLQDAMDADSSIAGIRYRLQTDDPMVVVGDTSAAGLLPFKVAEKNEFADVELTLLVAPDLLALTEQEEKASFEKIEKVRAEAAQALEQQVLGNARSMQANTVSALQLRVWLLAAVSVLVLVGVISWAMHRVVIVPLAKTKQHLLTLSGGDLTSDFDFHSGNELGEMAHAMNTMVEKLRRIVEKINTSVISVSNHADRLNHTTDTVAQGAKSQVGQTIQAASAITELSVSFEEVTRNSSNALDLAKSSSEMAQSGREIVSKTAQGMASIATTVADSSTLIGELDRNSEEVGRVVNVINGIAEQTNLLALNAAIEAARAGEQGRGFAVVADEVRTLAGRTAEATRDISRTIEKIQSDTGKSVKSMDSVSRQVQGGVEQAEKGLDAMDGIVSSSEESMQMAASIATAVEQQSMTTREVSASVESIAAVSRETDSTCTSMQEAAQELAQLGGELKKAISWFKSITPDGTSMPATVSVLTIVRGD